jgi:hypothetical protein
MLIMGCDLHTRYREIALLDTATGEVVTGWLEHENGEARAFYAGLPERARVGIAATGIWVKGRTDLCPPLGNLLSPVLNSFWNRRCDA